MAKMLAGAELRFIADDAPAVSVSCSNCDALCCRKSTVVLSLEEAQRLPHVFGVVTLSNGRALENVATLPRHPVSGACVFLQESRCSIWELRPQTCRVYDCGRR